jgi:potassium channel subfamily K, other eukaryote
MVQTLIFFFFVGICALIFSRVEGYTYVDGIYYIVVTILTIGFGDLTPHTSVMKVLTFPFTIIGITLLAVIVTSIVRLLLDRARRRKLQMKKLLKEKASEKKRKSAQAPGQRLKRSLTLQEELQKLTDDDWKRQTRSNLRSMAVGLTVFFMFWFIGALIFHLIEVVHFFNCLTVVLGIRKCSVLLLYVCPSVLR